MDVTNQHLSQFTIRFQHFLVLLWAFLRQPKTTGILLAVLAVIFGIGLALPQRSGPEITASLWVARLPVWLQGRGELLFALGFAQIFHSAWFWLPVALLFLHSLVALADYGGPSWRRFRETPGNLEWQHPLASRVEYFTRLPASPDEFLEKLKEPLQRRGFIVDKVADENRRLVSARRRAWSWLSLPVFYGSLGLLCLGFLVSHYSLQTERLTLPPFEARSSSLFDSAFQLSQFEAASGTGVVLYQPKEIPQTTLTWQLYRPALFQSALIWPIAAEPVLTVEAQDEAGEYRTLFSPQFDDVAPTTQLNLLLAEPPGSPLYFVIPSASLAFQIVPVTTAAGKTTYNIQFSRNSEPAPSENKTVPAGEAFEIDGLTIMLSPNHTLRVFVLRDWALPLYFISLIGLAGSILAFLISPPWQLWLIPDIKGRGGQLYGVAEVLGPARESPAFLEKLLTEGNPALETPAEEEIIESSPAL